MTIADQELLMRKIRRYTKHRDEIDQEITRLEGVLSKAREAQAYMESMTEEQRAVYRNAQAWKEDPNLKYIFDMKELF